MTPVAFLSVFCVCGHQMKSGSGQTNFYCENRTCEEYLKLVRAEVILTEMLQLA